MPLHKLITTDGFVCLDIADAPAAGIIRRAPKILQSGAWDLARSATYSFASFALPVSGASAGVNASDHDGPGAVDNAIAEIARLPVPIHLDPAKGVDKSAPLVDDDPRANLAGSVYLTAHSALAAAEWAVGDLAGKRLAIEGIDTSPVALAVAQEAHHKGAVIVAASGTGGSVTSSDGLDPFEMLNGDWLGEDPAPVNRIWGARVDVILAGSRAGTLNHVGAGHLDATAVVPWGPIPFTTRALAVASASNVTMVPDFVSAAGGLVGGLLDSTVDDAKAVLSSRITQTLDAAANHSKGLFVGACVGAEEFLGSWTEVPFGRPLAA